jgi:hypothetical protein
VNGPENFLSSEKRNIKSESRDRAFIFDKVFPENIRGGRKGKQKKNGGKFIEVKRKEIV